MSPMHARHRGRLLDGVAAVGLVALVAIAAIVLASSSSVDAQTPPDGEFNGNEQVEPLGGKLSPPVFGNLDSDLNQLLSRDPVGDDQLLGGEESASGARSDSGESGPSGAGNTVAVEVFFDLAHRQAVLNYLRSNGANVREPREYEDTLLANVPVSLLPALSVQPGVVGVVVARGPDPLTAGANAHGANRWQGGGYRGAGVRIAVFDAGFSGYSTHIGSALPTPSGVRCFTRDVNVQHTTLRACETASVTGHGATVTEMVYDVAPEAEYFLATGVWFNDLSRAVDWFNDNDVDVVVVSLSTLFEGPGDGTTAHTGRYIAAINRAVSFGMTVVISAGNDNNRSWFGRFVDSDNDGVLDWAAGDECNRVYLVAGRRYSFRVRWNGTWRGATTDLDIYLTRGGAVQAKSEDAQSGGGSHDPHEEIGYTAARTANYCLTVQQRSGSIPRWTQLVVLNSSLDDLRMEYKSDGYSILSPAEMVNPGVLAVGAAPYNSTSAIASYSARGPLPNGTIKPDIVGAANVYSASLGGAALGTSFAAPHVAGLAALLKQRFPWYTPAEIAQYLKDHAQSRGDPVPNSTWGYGFAQIGGTPATGTVAISGRTEVAQTFTATANVSDVDGASASDFRWQWYRVDGRTRTPIAGATSRGMNTSTYTAVDDDEGKALAALLRFEDGAGNAEAVFSSPTAVLAGEPTTLASNLNNPGRPDHITLVAGRRIAQPFETGRGALGYNLREVTIDLIQPLPDGARYTVGLYETDANYDPGDLVVRLNGDLTSSGRQRFTPAAATILERATRYNVVIEVTSLGSTGSLVNAYVDYKRLAARPTFIAEPGWSLWGFSYYRSSGDTEWTQYEVFWGVAIKGDAIPPDNAVRFSHSSYSVTEGGTANVTLELDRPAQSALTFPVVATAVGTAQSGDYSGIPTNVTFAAGDTQATFTITGVQDTEDDDGVFVQLGFGTLPSGIVSVSPSLTTIYIIDDDLPDVTVAFAAASYSVDEGGQVEVTIRLSALAERAVVIPISVYGREQASADRTFQGNLDEYASSATDYSGVPDTVTFTSDDTRKSFTFRATEEMVNDDGERVVLSFGTLPPQVTATRATTTVSLGDNDLPDVKVRFGAASYTVAESQSISVPIELDVAPGRQVVIPLVATLEGGISETDYVLVPSSEVTFGAGETHKTLSFTALPDAEANEEGERLKLSFGTTLPDQVTVDDTIPAGETLARDTTTVAITDVAAAPGRPDRPTVAGRDRQLIVTWTAPGATGGADITRYQLRRILSSASSSDKVDPTKWTPVSNAWATGGGDLTYTFRGLANGSSYDVQVAARNTIGISRWSATTSGTPFRANRPPVFPLSETGARSVNEDAMVGDNIGAPVRADDPDRSTLLYALKTASDYISINERTGQLQVKAVLDHEDMAAHVVTVTVTDLANANAIPNEVVDAEIEVTITVRDINEAPGVSGVAAIEVAENSTGVLATYLAEDPEGDTITEWSLGGSDAGDFTIDSSGRLSFANPPDFDDPADHDVNNEYRVRVRAKDVRKRGRFDVVVTVTSIDEAPVIAGEATLEFAENARTAVASYTATDPEGANTYWQALSGADEDLFQLTGSGDLRFVDPPDFETKADADGDNAYEVTLTAADREENGKTSSLAVTVAVTGVGEPPAIAGEQVPNFAEGGTDAVAEYTVSDPDGQTTMFTWGLAGPDHALFDLTASGTSATLAFKTPPDFETPAGSRRNNEYQITIEATDEANDKGTFGVLVTVTNDNDAPTLTGGPDTITVAEDVTGTIGTYTATDPERAPIVWSVEGTDGADFAINEMGQLSFATRADAETQTSHSITVVASDGDPTTPLTARKAVTVTVTGVDEPPEISPAADIEWDENSSGTVVTFTATDPEGVHTTFTFSLEGDDAGDFTLTSAGVLTFQNPPDYEAPADADTDNEYLITVEADDGDKTGSLDLTVTVADANEPPTITPTGDITRVENSTGTVADYNAVDPEGVTDTFTWSLSGDDAEDFRLHAESGSLTFVNSPDYDDPADADGDNVYLLTIGVTDGDIPNSTDVAVTVTNVNEPPVITGGDAAITEAENFEGTLATYTAEDPEGVTAFVWSLEGTDREDLAIEASTGALSFKAPPDFDNPLDSRSDGSLNTYNVTVKATEPDDLDSQTTELADTVEVLITITAIDELPVITGPTDVTDYPENSPTTREVGRYSASDPDGGNVTWGALTGAGAGAFVLSSDGVLTFEEPPDFETQSSYEVTVNASDGRNPVTLDVSVTVSNVNEAPAVARQTGTGAFSIVENIGMAIGTFVVMDPEGDNVEWSVAGTDARHFEISQSGALSFLANPDHDNPLDSNSDGSRNTYNVIVRATEEDDQDSGTTELTGSLAVLVRVTDVDEAPVVEGPTTIGAFPENSATTTVVGRYSATDPEGRGWTWSPLTGDDADSFVLSPDGVLTFGESPDHETKEEYTVTLNASDGQEAGSLTVEVTVTDVNEPPVVARETGTGAFSIVENSGTAVGTFEATDLDAGDDAVEWSVAGIDGGHFVVENGALSFKANPDYDNPLDSSSDGSRNTYNVIVRAREQDDGDPQTTELTGSLDVLVRVTNVNEAPVVTPSSAVTSGSLDYAENRTNRTVATFTASDPDRQTVVWQALAGDDADHFTFINGTLSFGMSPNFEDPQDVAPYNTYNVTISASDGAESGTYDLLVQVTNVDEIGSLGLSSTQPQTETALTATLTDPDIVGATTWLWERSEPGGWGEISGETGNSYTPVAADEDQRLRVTATYDDGHGSGKSLTATSINAVQLRPPDNTAPDFGNTTATRSVPENSAANTHVGPAVAASDTEDAGDLAYTLTGSTLFTIVGTSGQIRVASGAALDHEDDDEHEVTVTATDPSRLTDTITVTIGVTDVNEPPTAVTDTVSTSEDTAVTFLVHTNDTDPETPAANLVVSLGSTRTGIGSVTLDATTKEVHLHAGPGPPRRRKLHLQAVGRHAQRHRDGQRVGRLGERRSRLRRHLDGALDQRGRKRGRYCGRRGGGDRPRPSLTLLQPRRRRRLLDR